MHCKIDGYVVVRSHWTTVIHRYNKVPAMQCRRQIRYVCAGECRLEDRRDVLAAIEPFDLGCRCGDMDKACDGGDQEPHLAAMI